MMAEETFFLLNEFLEKEKKELEYVLDVVYGKHAKDHERAVFVRNFTNELFKAHRRTKKKVPEIKKVDEKQLLLRKKLELLRKLQQLKQVHEIKIPEQSKEKDLILSKETGKPLVKTEFDNNKYTVKEPELTEQDKNIIKELKVVDIENKQKLLDKLKELCTKYNISYADEYYDKIRYYLVRDNKKYGKISALVEDKEVKEIICEGSEKSIIITYQDKQDILTNVSFGSEEELNKFILDIAKKANQKLTVENPFFNTTLGNMNIQATLGSEFVKAKFVISKQ